MTHPPATCELCGDTGLYSPSALPCPKGCSAEDIVDRLRAHDLDLVPDWRDDADMHSWMDTADALMSESAEYITNLRQALSEAEQREKYAISPFEIVANWHDKQARTFKEMSQDVRSGELGRAKAAEASKHHAGSAAALRLHVINERRAAFERSEG